MPISQSKLLRSDLFMAVTARLETSPFLNCSALKTRKTTWTARVRWFMTSVCPALCCVYTMSVLDSTTLTGDSVAYVVFSYFSQPFVSSPAAVVSICPLETAGYIARTGALPILWIRLDMVRTTTHYTLPDYRVLPQICSLTVSPDVRLFVCSFFDSCSEFNSLHQFTILGG